jgi:hypothetical protein
LRAVVERFKAAATVAREKIADAEARARLSEVVYQRRQRLASANAVSQQVVDEAAREHQGAVVGIQIARMELELVQAQLREAEVTLSYATIRAPISGIVSSVTTQQGETFAAGLTAPTFLTIIDLDRLQVNALVDRYHHQLHPKPWAKSPEEAAWALMQRIMGSWPMGWLMVGLSLRSKKGEQYNVSLLPLGFYIEQKIFCRSGAFRPNWGRFWGEGCLVASARRISRFAGLNHSPDPRRSEPRPGNGR